LPTMLTHVVPSYAFTSFFFSANSAELYSMRMRMDMSQGGHLGGAKRGNFEVHQIVLKRNHGQSLRVKTA
jgi:hypothetical protein